MIDREELFQAMRNNRMNSLVSRGKSFVLRSGGVGVNKSTSHTGGDGSDSATSWVLTTGVWDNSKYWDNTAFYKNAP